MKTASVMELINFINHTVYAHSWESGIRADDVGCRRSVSSGKNMLVSREPSFVYSKRKPVSYWLISKFYAISLQILVLYF